MVKCGVSGPPETGKTHVRALMQGKPRPPPQRASTALATEADHMTPDFARMDAEEDFLNTEKTSKKGYVWKEVKGDNLGRVIANTLHNEDYSKTTNLTGSAENFGTHVRSQRRKLKLITDIKKQLKKLKGKPKRKRKGLNGMRFVFYVDTGGQPQFQEILPNFIKCDINILVHNLSQALEYCPPFDYAIDGKRYSVPERMRLSNLTIIEQSVRSITSSLVTADVDRRPHVVILGTFKDKCIANPVEFDRMLREKSKTINEKIKPYVGLKAGKCNVYSPQRGKDQVIVAIDGSEGGWGSNYSALEKLKLFIDQQAVNRPFEVPIKYFIFLHHLKAQAKKGMAYTTLDACSEIASACNMAPMEVKDALKLFNKFNIILYFPEILENIAFLKPGYLFGMVTDLIVSSFQCESDNLTSERSQFQDTGIFTAAILQQITSLQLSSGEFTQQLFLKLLKGLFVIAELEDKLYFMPCVLPLGILSREVTEYKEIMTSKSIDGPFVLSFTSKMSPRGLFCAMLVALAGRPEWSLPIHQGCGRFRNLVEFCIHKNTTGIGRLRIGHVAIIDRNSCLEVYTTCERSELPDIRQAVCESLVKACSNLNYNPNDLLFFGFPCQCKDIEPHATEAYPDKEVWKERCSVNRRGHHSLLSKEKAVWFGNDLNVGKLKKKDTLAYYVFRGWLFGQFLQSSLAASLCMVGICLGIRKFVTACFLSLT